MEPVVMQRVDSAFAQQVSMAAGVKKVYPEHFKAECSPGMFGDNCQHLCDCESKISCHPVTGKCLCPPGRAGARCEAECRPGQYGPNCALTCQCVHRAQCNPLNGSCTCPSKRMGPTCEENVLDDLQ
ncbi:Multiple epidermal growth factor-like domains protein 6 [Myotis brandtii]|uniref:Multiple epidermal growth factor-like domains protein 6 n=1 Tax=Myotis brandtii TaxID=109478 RepID=S7NS06_MYOBR|nr:Multiple epidermal growth factor-like domains protein 6 [Myotis brandtii]